MTKIRVEETISAPPEVVWAAIEDISSHVRWMEDAVAIRFTSAIRSGVGAAFDCDTRVGPFRLTDRMVVTEWDPPRAMGIRHTGVVTGARCSRSGSDAASSAICSSASASPSRLSRDSVSVGSAIMASSTTSGKYTVGGW